MAVKKRIEGYNIRKYLDKSLTMKSGDAASTCSLVWDVINPSVFAPAALPLRMPAGASSTTRQRAGSTPHFSAPTRYGSGLDLRVLAGGRRFSNRPYAGFPFVTSSETTKTSGTSMPAELNAALAYSRVADVQMPHTGVGNLAPE